MLSETDDFRSKLLKGEVLDDPNRKDVLLDVFLLDGHEQKTFVLLYLPLFLTNARANQDQTNESEIRGSFVFIEAVYLFDLLFANL